MFFGEALEERLEAGPGCARRLVLSNNVVIVAPVITQISFCSEVCYMAHLNIGIFLGETALGLLRERVLYCCKVKGEVTSGTEGVSVFAHARGVRGISDTCTMYIRDK